MVRTRIPAASDSVDGLGEAVARVVASVVTRVVALVVACAVALVVACVVASVSFVKGSSLVVVAPIVADVRAAKAVSTGRVPTECGE